MKPTNQSGGPCASLSKWLRGSVHHLQHYQESAEELAEFFESNVTFAAERKQQRMQEQEQEAIARKQKQQKMLKHKKMLATTTMESNSVKRLSKCDGPNGSKCGCSSQQGATATDPGINSNIRGASTESLSDQSFQGSSDDDFEDEPLRPQRRRRRSRELVSSLAAFAKQAISASSATGPPKRCDRKRGPKPMSTRGSNCGAISIPASSSPARCKINGIDIWLQRGEQVCNN